MNNTSFSARECIAYGWETFKKRPGIFIGAALVMSLVPQVINNVTSSVLVSAFASQGVIINPQHVLATVSAESVSFFLITVFVSIVVQVLVSSGSANFYLKAVRSPEALAFGDLWAPKFFFPCLATDIAVGIVVLLGLVALIIPGIWLSFVYGFSLYAVIDREHGVRDAMRFSKKITKGQVIELVGLAVFSFFVLTAGVLALLVGLLVALPVVALARARAYRVLVDASSESLQSPVVAA